MRTADRSSPDPFSPRGGAVVEAVFLRRPGTYNLSPMGEERRILALETSGRLGAVAVGTQDGVLASTTLTASMRHAAELMPAIEKLLGEQGWPARTLTDVFVSIGPGSFTGLRVGVSIARTLAWSVGARIVAVPTLDALARNATLADPAPRHVAVLLDAKRQQVYAAAFAMDAGGCRRIIGASLEDPVALLARCPRPLAVLGEGINYHRAAVEASGARVLDPGLWGGRPEHIFAEGLALARDNAFTPGGDLIPFYIRRPEAEEKWEQLHPPVPNNG
jgi:tRNA threonylcarbamoyladenosine biosynthesis protein TsaB